MAKRLIVDGGQPFKERDDGSWQPLSPSEYVKEQILQQHVQGQGGGTQALTAAGKYFSDVGSGISQLFGDEENARQQQQNRADLQRQYQSQADYGGIGETLGSFLAPGATAVIPGGLAVQSGIGGAQGAAEQPDSPIVGALTGIATTFAGDWAGNAIGRIARTLTNKRVDLSPDPQYREIIERGREAGLEFTPGQAAGDPARQIMERELAKNPRYAGLDMDRFLSNQARLNDLAAETLGVNPTGRVTGAMRGEAKQSVKQAFDAVAEESSPITVLGEQWLRETENLTEGGQALMERFINKYPDLFRGEPVSGAQFNQARNWLAEQGRKGFNIKSGAADEVQPFLRVLDDSLEAANIDTNPMLVDEIRRARTKWKALLTVEASQRGAQQAAGGNLSADAAYNALRKYDKGGLFRGKSRGPFDDAIEAMAATGDKMPPPRPSGDPSLASGPVNYLSELLWKGPAAEKYMKGQPLGELMLGVMEKSKADKLMKTLGIGAGRGIMENDEQFPQ